MPLKKWKKAIRMKKLTSVIHTARTRRLTHARWVAKPAFGGAVMCVAAAALVVVYEASPRTPAPIDTTAANTDRPIAPAQTTPAPAPTPVPHKVARAENRGEKTIAAAPLIEAPAIEPTSAPADAQVSITGCLEQSDEMFRLKDTSGSDAPKARSWKSGFLKKGSAPIAVMDPAKRVNLANHVGQRVTVTGTLIDRELRVRSLQRVAPSCDGKART